ncbi:MAG: hypothetical protein AAGA69_09840 [Pseudomonadota bacterium]
METWAWILLAAIGLFLATSLLKAVVGFAAQYLIFVALAGLIYQGQTGAEASFLDVKVMSTIATIGALAFAFTLGVMAVLFRNSRFKLVLFPMVGFATTFAAAAMVTQSA